MRISVILNTRAGTTQVAKAEEQIRSALFRCQLEFAKPNNREELIEFLDKQIKEKTDCLVIVGGDGTINFCLQQIKNLGYSLSEIPPIALVSGGTANDLAFELGISKKIERAARLVLSGKVQNIDVIEIKDEKDNFSYMVTNGGIGLPAIAADHANQVRTWLKDRTKCEFLPYWMQDVADVGYKGMRKLGQRIYTATAVSAISTWKQSYWELEMNSPMTGTFKTNAPIIFINNQSRLGGSFKMSHTFNTDGAFNVLLAEAPSTFSQVKALLDLRKGLTGLESNNKSFESQNLEIRSLCKDRGLTFFGDGEILIRDAEKLNIKCLASSLKLMVAAT